MKRPHIRSLMISEYVANVMINNELWPSQFSHHLINRAYERAAVSRFLRRKRAPLIFAHIEGERSLAPGRCRYRYERDRSEYRAFRYRAGDDRILYENANKTFHYKETARGTAKLAIISDWLPEIMCAAIQGERVNAVVEDKGYLFQALNPVIRRARNGRYRGRRAVILTLDMPFAADFWNLACP